MGIDNLKDLKRWADSIEELAEDTPAFLKHCVKDIAAELIRRMRLRAPVERNQTIKYKGKGGVILTKEIVGGNYRRGWTANKDQSPESYLNTVSVSHSGGMYSLTLVNNVEYAAELEYGHRQNVGQFVPFLGEEDAQGVRQGATLKKSFVPGLHIMEISEQEVEAMAPDRLEQLLEQWLLEGLGWSS